MHLWMLTAGLDNLPGEVVFLLKEIQEKDERINREQLACSVLI